MRIAFSVNGLARTAPAHHNHLHGPVVVALREASCG